MLFLPILLCLQETEVRPPDAAGWALLYLARHQNEDGSWGGTPKSCSCAPVKARELDEAGRRRLGELAALLERPHPAVRDAASKEIAALGAAAVPALEGIRSSDVEVRARVRDLADRLRPPPERGDVELTALAILSFMGQGNSHLCKDFTGPAIRKGLEWLQKAQKADGSFVEQGGARPNALATLALAESYGLLWEEPAVKGCAFIRGLHVQDSESIVWKAIVLNSGRQQERLPVGAKEEVISLTARIEARRDGWERAAFILDGRDRLPNPAMCNAMVSRMTWGTNRALVVALDLEAPRGAGLADEGWKAPFGARIKPGQREDEGCERGSWNGDGLRRRLVETARRAVAFGAYHFPYDVR